MSYPKYYDKVEDIELYDPLSEVLGTFEKGNYSISYKEVVKSAGHSCPTVSGAYLMTLVGLKALYGDLKPTRGEIKVEFKESLEEGVAGVIANVVTHITGATLKSGFKGLAGLYSRHSLMSFEQDIISSVRFTRMDTQEKVDVFYNPNEILANPKMQPLMQKILQNNASSNEKYEFGILWQERVEKIFLNIEKVLRVEKV
jgi:formylmethanofuran dehydrogenase subunit E